MPDQPTHHPIPVDAGGQAGPAAHLPTDRRRAPRNRPVKLTRDPSAIAGRSFDLIVIGGGAFGAWAAYDAAQRGLSVALLEKNDFGSGTSADALRTVHTRAEAQRMRPGALRKRAAERRALMTVAPHLVQPLEVRAPRYAPGRGAKLGMAVRMALRVASTTGVGRGLHDPDRRDCWAGTMGFARLRRTHPELPRRRLVGAEQWPALQVVCPERLVLAVVQSAVCRGAKVLNHAEADGLIVDGSAVIGVTVSDRHTGECFSVHSHAVLNATGPDAGDLLMRGDHAIELPAAAARDEMVLVTGRRLVPAGCALALPLGADEAELFVSPSGDGGSLIGPWPLPEDDASTGPAQTRSQAVAACLTAVNHACPGWRLSVDDLQGLSVSRVPQAGHRGAAANVVDHGERDGVYGLFSLVGLRYDAAHTAASDVLDRVLEHMNLPESVARTTLVPLVGGDIAGVQGLSDELTRLAAGAVRSEVLGGLLRRHGAQAIERMRAAIDAGETDTVPGTGVLSAELTHAADEECAMTLTDAVLGRLGWIDAGGFSEAVPTEAADAMASVRGWSDAECRKQIHALRAAMREHAIPGSPDDPHFDDVEAHVEPDAEHAA